MYKIELSVFFPCYNENLNILRLVMDSMKVLDNLVGKYEILIINDGSTDNTSDIADKLSNKYQQVRVIHHSSNKGYGASLISGFTNSKYEWVFFTDADQQFFISEIDLLLKHVHHYDLIIGYRKQRKDIWYRVLYGRLWTFTVQKLFELDIKDIDCAFKLINKSLLSNITLNFSSACINAELLVKLIRSGAKIKQIGVSHRPRVYGKQTGGRLTVALKAILDLYKLRRNLFSPHFLSK